MDDIWIVKATNYVNDGVCLTNVGKELISQTFTLRSTFYDTRDVHEFHCCWNYFLWFDEGSDFIHTRIWNCHHTDIGINCTKRIIRCFGFR
ncbi:hypothetical protein D3C87_1546090 [compost metagenome]